MSGVKKVARERSMTAAEAAKRFNRVTSNNQTVVALDRKDYLKRAAEKRKIVADMRAVGSSWDEIAEAVGTTPGGARSLFCIRYMRNLKAEQKKKEEKLDQLRAFLT